MKTEEHTRSDKTGVTLVGVESEIHVCDVGSGDAIDQSGLAASVLGEIRRRFGLKVDGSDSLGDTALCEYLPNGSRCYNDHDYVEYATPALADTTDAVAAVRAGDRIVQSAVTAIQKEKLEAKRLLAVRNNVDHHGHSYAAHVNVRMHREGYERIFSDDRFLHGTVVPFFVTLPLICGSGSVYGEQGNDGFEIWQRSSFIKKLVGEETVVDRPLVNTRDESLSADPTRYARLHVIHLDANRAEVAQFCKLGLMKLFCAAVDVFGELDISLELDNPINAVWSVSKAPFQALQLQSKKTMTPLEIQRHFLGVFHRLFTQGAFDHCVPDAKQILDEVDRVLTALKRDLFGLVGSLDWVTKFVWLQQFRKHNGLKWSDPKLRWVDIQYHALSAPKDLRLPKFQQIAGEGQVRELMQKAPNGSRAAIRGAMVREFSDDILDANWHWVACRDGQTAYALPDDPPDGAPQSAESAETLKDYAGFLQLDRIPVTPIVIVPCTGCVDSEEDMESCNPTPTTTEA